jgi:hypothetical protein
MADTGLIFPALMDALRLPSTLAPTTSAAITRRLHTGITQDSLPRVKKRVVMILGGKLKASRVISRTAIPKTSPPSRGLCFHRPFNVLSP